MPEKINPSGENIPLTVDFRLLQFIDQKKFFRPSTTPQKLVKNTDFSGDITKAEKWVKIQACVNGVDVATKIVDDTLYVGVINYVIPLESKTRPRKYDWKLLLDDNPRYIFTRDLDISVDSFIALARQTAKRYDRKITVLPRADGVVIKSYTPLNAPREQRSITNKDIELADYRAYAEERAKDETMFYIPVEEMMAKYKKGMTGKGVYGTYDI